MQKHNWLYYTKLTAESVAAFYVATFCIAYNFTHFGTSGLPISLLLVATYLFVIGTITYRIVKGFPIAGLMLAVPIAPLLVLIIIVTMIPLLERI